ncbi:P-loop containing nucleoside triphosphate hydrolase protein [Usnea florida]
MTDDRPRTTANVMKVGAEALYCAILVANVLSSKKMSQQILGVQILKGSSRRKESQPRPFSSSGHRRHLRLRSFPQSKVLLSRPQFLVLALLRRSTEMPSSSSRQVDKLPAVHERSKEMQVLCVGLSRTATLSMCVALKQLGYTPYHGGELLRNPKSLHTKCWREGLTERRSTGKSFGLTEFDRLLGNYDAVTDAPCANFANELMAAYPQAKVILTTRDPDAWVRSMGSCYYRILNMLQWWNPLVYYDPDFWGEFGKLVQIILTELTSGDVPNRAALRRGYIMHNEHIRRTVPKDKFLDFQPADGWAPLCAFLGKEVPSGPFPHVNEGGKAADGVKVLIALNLIQMSAVPVAFVAVGLVAWSWALS